jgi:hypothetical protein
MKNALQRGAQNAHGVLRAKRTKAKAASVQASHLRWALSELAHVMRALTLSRQQTHAARERVQSLTEHNSLLERELTELARREAQDREFAHHDEHAAMHRPPKT